MPVFSTIRETLALGKKLSASELARALRFSIAAEYEAVQIYEQIIESIDDPQIKAVIMDIVQEEKVHAGQFIGVLFEVAPEEAKYYDQGTQENKKIKRRATKA